MIDRGAATDDEMVLAFLRAEANSSRYGKTIKSCLAQHLIDPRVIYEPNLADAAENGARKRLLGCYRGFPQGALFAGFPRDAVWRRVRLEPRDFETMRYINDTNGDRHWVNLTDGTRLVSDGAHNILARPTNRATQQIVAIAEDIRKGVRFPELIAAQDKDGSLILIEGHSRATAYVMEQYPGEVEALVASSQSLSAWVFY